MALAIVLGIAFLIVLGLWAQPRWQDARRRRLRARPFPAAWRAILRRRVPLYRRLPPDLQRQLREHVLVFLAEKRFIGCAGMPVNDEVRVTIAGQACLLLLNRPVHYFTRLRQVLVYPGPFVVRRVHADGSGVLHDQRRALAGESWQQGQVILSWQDVVEGARVPDDGRNVVLHEFAHQLDQETGVANGAPHLPSRERHLRWSRAMTDAFVRLQWRLDAGVGGDLIGDYAAQNPAEFFAVLSELFFERPGALADEHPALFDELKDYFAVDPREWH
jgi:Mlc titration factor MtfA (ptsG expression regulator)